VVAVGLAGLAVGGFTLLMQGTLPGFLNQLGNSGAVWSAAAFAAGAVLAPRGRRSAVVGLVLLLGAVLGYYGCTTVLLHDDVSAAALRGPALWAGVAVVAGPVFGLAGAQWRGPDPLRRLLAAGALGAVFVAEGLYLAAVLEYVAEAALMIGLGLAAPLLLGRSATERWRGLLAVAPLLLLAGAALAVVYGLTVVVLR
jgi:hypothetical protein